MLISKALGRPKDSKRTQKISKEFKRFQKILKEFKGALRNLKNLKEFTGAQKKSLEALLLLKNENIFPSTLSPKSKS